MSRTKRFKHALILTAACAMLVSGERAVTAGPTPAPDTIFRDLLADGVPFQATLNGASEVPATDSAATGEFTGRLTGTPGRYILAFDMTYRGVTSGATDAHIHQAIDPPGSNPLAQEGPVVFRMPDLDGGPLSATWSWNDPRAPLTDALVDSMFDGELYVNVHSQDDPDGEIRGQIAGAHEVSVRAVPLPAPLALGALGMGLVVLVKRMRFGNSLTDQR